MIDPNHERPDRCGTCRFFDTEDFGPEDRQGECHRYAPIALSGMAWAGFLSATRSDEEGEAQEISDSGFSFWATVMNYDWCGEWQAKSD